MNHKKLELPPRLQLLADWVPSGAIPADIGTDHGYLPVWLLLHDRIEGAIATDLRRLPLAHAKSTAAAYGVSDRITFKLGNGLQILGPQEADTIVIAGMGGENIAAILKDAPWTADGSHTLLLQPMSRSESLRAYLAENGYAIVRERLVEDRNTIYPVLLARGGEMKITAGEQYGGVALQHDPLWDRYLIERILRLQRAVSGLNHSADKGDAVQADQLRDILTELMNMREEWRHANSGSN